MVFESQMGNPYCFGINTAGHYLVTIWLQLHKEQLQWKKIKRGSSNSQSSLFFFFPCLENLEFYGL